MKRKSWHVRVDFDPYDLWVGVYIDPGKGPRSFRLARVYVCIVPCLPIVFYPQGVYN